MTKKLEEFSQVFERRLRQSGTNTFYADVVAVDEAARTCCVEMEGIPYENVLLYSVEKADLKGFVILPATGSRVIVSRLGDGWFVELFSVIDKVLLTIGENVALSVDQEEITYKNGQVSLKINGSAVELSANAITLNGGGLDGLVKINDITTKLNELVETFNSHTHSGVITAVSGGSGNPAVGIPGNSATTTLDAKPFSKTDYENTKVKQ